MNVLVVVNDVVDDIIDDDGDDVSLSTVRGDPMLSFVHSVLGFRMGEACVNFENEADLFGVFMVCPSIDDGCDGRRLCWGGDCCGVCDSDNEGDDCGDDELCCGSTC